MKTSESILKRQKYNTRFKNEDMDFMLNWTVGVSQLMGLSPAQAFFAVHGIKDGDPLGWSSGFHNLGEYELEQAQEFASHPLTAGQFHLGAAYAYRAALQYTDPSTPEFGQRVEAMERAFQRSIELLGIPMHPIEVPFEGTTLPGYYLEHDDQSHPVVVMVGGGDTFREDLFYFAGYPGWKRGYNVIMVDLPGQGITPNRGQYFRIDMETPISAVLDWLEANAAVKPVQIAIYGVSGGGYFSTQAVATDARIKAWIASTPIFDVGKLFEREFGRSLNAPGWLMNAVIKVTGAFNESAEISARKYAWQFGTTDFKTAITRVLKEAIPVDYTNLNCPALFLMSEGEGPELIRQTLEITDNFLKRGVNVTMREFTAAEGADGHCQLNNLRLAHLIIFDWLDHIFEHDSGDSRRYI